MEKRDPEGTYRDDNGRLRDIKTNRFRTDPNKSPSVSRKSRGGRSASATPREEEEQDRSRSGDEQQVSSLTTLPNSVDTTGDKRRPKLKPKTGILNTPEGDAILHRHRLEEQIRQGTVAIPFNSAQGTGIFGGAAATSIPLGVRATGDQSSTMHMNIFTDEQVMSPNGPEETHPVREEIDPGVLQWSINSQPPTPRKGDTGGEHVRSQTMHSEYEQAFERVCCQCGETMPTGGVVCSCRCVHRCHEECKHFCENDDVVCIHCNKKGHFVQGQPFHPPMTHEELLRNIDLGISIPRGSKVRNLEERRLEVLQGLAMATPEEPGAPGLRAGVSGENNMENGTSGLRAEVPQIVCVPCSVEPAALAPGATQRSDSASGGKRTLDKVAEPPGLGAPDESKARRIQN
eukprot:3095034-Amphidinium_carterae.1